jgi:phosphomannomutase
MTDSLRAALRYEPVELKFGTSGRRGLITDLTHLEVYINAAAELEYLLGLPASEGGIVRGDEFYFASDLRPSSPALAQAIVAALLDAGMRPVNLGLIPTPALAYYALSQGKGSIMVTGSHIPFDRNGYKLNTSRGELLKEHEGPIQQRVRQVRERIYAQPLSASRFDESGRLKHPPSVPEAIDAAARAYIERYSTFFGAGALAGLRLLVYQHSAVGRDMLVEILNRLGAETVVAGRSDTFVPIDTENIDAQQLGVIQALADQAEGRIDAVVSTDGDSDRPLLLGVDAAGKVRFFGGDLLGMVVAEYLQADAVVVPVSCNDGIDRGRLASVVEPKTRIGSPFVIAGMEAARRNGKTRVCGWEANGGFLTGADIERNGTVLTALPTRDAMLPILAVLSAARASGSSLIELFDRLPRRYSRAALLKQFPRPVSERIVARFTPPPGETGTTAIRAALATFFTAELGFDTIAAIDYTDGVRIRFSSGEVAHLRPSGNADELRMYAVADTQERADAIAALGVADPGGILRRMEAAVVSG